jgi:tetratricopeptide (TPR) repeat protein
MIQMHSSLWWWLPAALAAAVALPGCITHPRLGKDEGRAAIVWENPGFGAGAPNPAEKETERELLAEMRQADEPGGDELAQASTKYRLAILRRQQGNLTEAEDLYQQALAIRERKQGPTHPDVAVVLNNLAAVYAAEGKYDAAQPLLERSVEIRQTALGEDNVLTAESLNNLALLYAAQGKPSAAEPLYRRAIAVLEKQGAAPAPTQGELDRVLENYAALLYDTGRDREAEAIETRAHLLRASSSRPAGALRDVGK